MYVTFKDNRLAEYELDPQTITSCFSLDGITLSFSEQTKTKIVLDSAASQTISFNGISRAKFIVVVSDGVINITVGSQVLPCYPIFMCSDNSDVTSSPITALSIARDVSNTVNTNVTILVYGV